MILHQFIVLCTLNCRVTLSADLMLGKPPTEDISALIAAMGSGSDEEQWTMEREECVVQLVEYCHQLLLTEDEECLGGWALVEPFYR